MEIYCEYLAHKFTTPFLNVFLQNVWKSSMFHRACWRPFHETEPRANLSISWVIIIKYHIHNYLTETEGSDINWYQVGSQSCHKEKCVEGNESLDAHFPQGQPNNKFDVLLRKKCCQFKVQIIGILEEIDSFIDWKFISWKCDRKPPAFLYYDSWWDAGGIKSNTGGIHPTWGLPKPQTNHPS